VRGFHPKCQESTHNIKAAQSQSENKIVGYIVSLLIMVGSLITTF